MKSESLNKLGWQKLKQNKLSFFALCYIVLVVLIGVFAVIISPDSSPDANEMHIELATQKLFAEATFLEMPKNEYIEIPFLESVFVGSPSKVKRIAIDSFKIIENGIEYLPYRSDIKQRYIVNCKYLQIK